MFFSQILDKKKEENSNENDSTKENHQNNVLIEYMLDETVSKKQRWDNIIDYMQENSVVVKENEAQLWQHLQDFASKKPGILETSPLERNTIPNRTLQKFLTVEFLLQALEQQAPSRVMAAFFQHAPTTVLTAPVEHTNNSYVIHILAKRPTGGTNIPAMETLKCMKLCLEAVPESVVFRDKYGKTPLHVLLEYHAESRSIPILQLFTTTVPRQVWEHHAKVALPSITSDHHIIPYSAISITDTIHGSYPLFYAVNCGATNEMIQFLLESHPTKQALLDHSGRTALHWYFHSIPISTPGTSVEQESLMSTRKSNSVLQLLTSPNVMRMQDHKGNTPLHYAASLIALAQHTCRKKNILSWKSLLKLVHLYPSALTTINKKGQTPLHVFFSTIHNWNRLEYQEVLSLVIDYKMDSAQFMQQVQPPHPLIARKITATKLQPQPFEPLLVIVQILIYGRSLQTSSKKGICIPHDDEEDEDDLSDLDDDAYGNVASSSPNKQKKEKETSMLPTEIKDQYGMQPLHWAVLTVVPPDVSEELIGSHPSSMITTAINGNNKEDVLCLQTLEQKLGFPTESKAVLDGKTPLHLALSFPYTSQLHTVDTIDPLLRHHSKQSDLFTSQTIIDESDGTLATTMKDNGGNFPLHLAAGRISNLELLQKIFEKNTQAVYSTNANGDLPIHLILDKYGLFDNVDLASLQQQQSPSKLKGYSKMVALAKKQHSTNRLSSLKLGGAVMAPSRGWTSDEEDVVQKRESLEKLQKYHTLLEPLCQSKDCLQIASPTRQSMTPLHIGIAFHCLTYVEIHSMLQTCPEIAHATTRGWTALDLHVWRKKISGEVCADEQPAWDAIYQLLYSYTLPPTLKQSVFLSSCANHIRQDIQGLPTPHSQPPIHNIHTQLGFSNQHKQNNEELGDVCCRIWTFFVSYTNPSDSTDHYAPYVQAILFKLDFSYIQKLIFQTVNDENLLDVANVYCKQIIHKFFYFAGLYDFTPPSKSSILLHRTSSSLLLQATEVHCSTADNDDDDDQNIVTQLSNVHLSKSHEDAGGMEVEVDKRFANFKVIKDGVCIKFMKDKYIYQREVDIRSILKEVNDEYIIPISAHYNAHGELQSDVLYAYDIVAERFRQLPLHTKTTSTSLVHASWTFDKEQLVGLGQDEWVRISPFPHAIVMPKSPYSLQDMVSRDLLPFPMDTIREVTQRVGRALEFLHGKHVVHGNLNQNHILSCENKWKLADFSSSRILSEEQKVFCGGIPTNGVVPFDVTLLPPEMFTKLEPSKLDMYEEYWKYVATEISHSNIPWSLVQPLIHPITGDRYVIKFHCELNPDELQEGIQLPPLPYELVPYSEAHDVWSFGLLVLHLCSGGYSILHTNGMTLMGWEFLVKWDDVDTAEELIFRHVDDLVAQDMLLHVLVDIQERSELSMSAILSHPFFLNPVPERMRQALQQIRTERDMERQTRSKLLEQQELSERDTLWLQANSIPLTRLTMSSQMKLAQSSTELLKEALNCVNENAPPIPTCLIILPYKLGRNKMGKLTPMTKQDVQLAEVIGKQFFHLNKTCFLLYKIQELSHEPEILKKWVKLAKVDQQVTIKELSDAMKLDKNAFESILTSLVSILSSSSDEDFVQNPITKCYDIVQQSIETLQSIFVEVGRSYLYLVDEMTGVPLQAPMYPLTIPTDMVLKFLPFTYTSTLVMRRATKSTGGLVRLIFEAAYPHTPPSWAAASTGLLHDISRHQIVSEIRLLSHVIDKMLSLAEEDTFRTLKDFIETKDKGKTYCGLRHVTDQRAVIWTTDAQIQKLQNEGELSNLMRVYEKEQLLKEQLKAKDLKILELENALKQNNQSTNGWNNS